MYIYIHMYKSVYLCMCIREKRSCSTAKSSGSLMSSYTHFIYIYICLYVCIHTCIHMHWLSDVKVHALSINTYICMYVYVYIHVYICIHMYTYIRIYIYTTYMYVRIYVYICIYMYICVHVYGRSGLAPQQGAVPL